MSDDEDIEDEDNNDEEEDEYEDDDGGEDDEGGGHEHAFSFDEETEGVIIAGKAFDISGMLRKDLGEFALHVKKLAEKHGMSITVVPSGDLSDDSGPGPDEDLYSTVLVGFVSDWGGTYAPQMISREKALQAFKNAQNVSDEIWKEIGDKLGEKEREAYNEAPVALHLTCVGPLAAATLAFGVVGKEEGGGPGEFMYGQDMGQEPHEEGIWGLQVAYVQYESPESEEIDLSDEAHAQRVEKLGVDGAAYYLIGRYD